MICRLFKRWRNREKKRLRQDREWVERLNASLKSETHAGAMTREDMERLKS